MHMNIKKKGNNFIIYRAKYYVANSIHKVCLSWLITAYKTRKS